MYKIIIVIFLILALVVYSQVTENYQNMSYYSGYGGPVYSGVPSAGSPYIQAGYGQDLPVQVQAPQQMPQQGQGQGQMPQQIDYNQQQYY